MNSMDDSRTIAELMHRVKNNFQLVLSLINLQGDFAKDLTREDANERLMTRVHAIALVQELLYLSIRSKDDGASGARHTPSLSMGDLIERLIDYAVGLYSPRTTRDRFALVPGDDFRLGSQEAVAAALTFNEVILNAVLHDAAIGGFGLEINRKIDADRMILSWNHQAVHVDLAAGELPNQGLGALLIENYAAQLGGTVSYRSEPEHFIIDMSFSTARFTDAEVSAG
jgi:two-component sensor histidine kinase